MNLVDSCGWLEVGEDGPNAGFFAAVLGRPADLFVPTLCLFEVHRHLTRHRGQEAADEAVGFMRQGRVLELDTETAFLAAEVSLRHKLAALDALIYASAQRHGAQLWTQDAAFKGLPGVQYRRKDGR